MSGIFNSISSFFVSIGVAISAFFGLSTPPEQPVPVETEQSEPSAASDAVPVEMQKTVQQQSAASEGPCCAPPTQREPTNAPQPMVPGMPPDLSIGDERDDIVNVKDIAGTQYAKGKRFVYYNDSDLYRVIEGADFATFRTLSINVAKDSRAVYYRRDKIEGADPASFSAVQAQDPKLQALIQYAGWAKDARRVYCGGQVVAGSDGASFRFSGFYPIDRTQVYDPVNCGTVLSKEAVSFKDLGNGYARAGDSVFLFRSYRKTSYSPGYYTCYYSDTYVVGGDAEIACYATWGTYGGYTDWKVFKLTDIKSPSTLVSINAYYAKDATSVYHLGDPLTSSDPSSFRITTAPNRGEDKNYVYVDGNWSSRE